MAGSPWPGLAERHRTHSSPSPAGSRLLAGAAAAAASGTQRGPRTGTRTRRRGQGAVNGSGGGARLNLDAGAGADAGGANAGACPASCAALHCAVYGGVHGGGRSVWRALCQPLSKEAIKACAWRGGGGRLAPPERPKSRRNRMQSKESVLAKPNVPSPADRMTAAQSWHDVHAMRTKYGVERGRCRKVQTPAMQVGHQLANEACAAPQHQHRHRHRHRAA